MKKLDKVLLVSVIMLTLFGLLMIYSASSIWANYKFNDSFHYLKYQAIFYCWRFYNAFYFENRLYFLL